METLEIIIGMVFIYLLVSLLASIIQELWASLTSLRGKMLLKAIAKLLEVENQSVVTGEAKEKVFADFRKKVENSKIYQKYSDRYLGLKQLPSYLSADQVTSVIKELLEKDTVVSAPELPTEMERNLTFAPQTVATEPTMLSNMQEDDLRKQLNIIFRSSPAVPLPGERSLAGNEQMQVEEDLVVKAKRAFQQQYDEIMDRATDWYKRGIQWSLITIGLLIAIAFDADTIKIYGNLTSHPNERQQLLQIANDFVAEDRITIYTSDSTQIDPNAEPTERSGELRAVVDSLIKSEIRNVPAPLGLGWQTFPQNPQSWLIKIAGWIVTALAISLGAPFWFDLLKKLISIRNAGNRPQTATEKQKEVTEEP